MKKIFLALLAVLIAFSFASCSKKKEEPQKWEYKVLNVYGERFPGICKIGGENRLVPDEFNYKGFSLPQEELDSLGNLGWELVSVYTTIETDYPNFGNDKYVTGIRSNVRTSSLHYVFKRPLQEGKESSKKNASPTDSTATDSLTADSAAADSAS